VTSGFLILLWTRRAIGSTSFLIPPSAPLFASRWIFPETPPKIGPCFSKVLLVFIFEILFGLPGLFGYWLNESHFFALVSFYVLFKEIRATNQWPWQRSSFLVVSVLAHIFIPSPFLPCLKRLMGFLPSF